MLSLSDQNLSLTLSLSLSLSLIVSLFVNMLVIPKIRCVLVAVVREKNKAYVASLSFFLFFLRDETAAGAEERISSLRPSPPSRSAFPAVFPETPPLSLSELVASDRHSASVVSLLLDDRLPVVALGLDLARHLALAHAVHAADRPAPLVLLDCLLDGLAPVEGAEGVVDGDDVEVGWERRRWLERSRRRRR